MSADSNGYFEYDLIENCFSLLREYLPYLPERQGCACTLPIEILWDCYERGYVSDFETDADNVDRFPDAAATTLDYACFIELGNNRYGPERGELNPFADKSEFCVWMYLVCAASILMQCPGLREFWYKPEFNICALSKLSLYVVLDQIYWENISPRLLIPG